MAHATLDYDDATIHQVRLSGNDYHIRYDRICANATGKAVAKIHYYHDKHMQDEIREIEMIDSSFIMCHQLNDFNELIQVWNDHVISHKLEG